MAVAIESVQSSLATYQRPRKESHLFWRATDQPGELRFFRRLLRKPTAEISISAGNSEFRLYRQLIRVQEIGNAGQHMVAMIR